MFIIFIWWFVFIVRWSWMCSCQMALSKKWTNISFTTWCTNQGLTVLQKFGTVSHRIPLRSTSYRTVPRHNFCIPYRTVTATGSRYTVSRNTVPSEQFFYFSIVTIIRLIWKQDFFFSEHVGKKSDSYAFGKRSAAGNIWRVVKQLLRETNSSIFKEYHSNRI